MQTYTDQTLQYNRKNRHVSYIIPVEDKNHYF